MPIYVKVGAIGTGSWRQIADGAIRFKKPSWELDNSTWFVPTSVKVKVGDIGTGSWRDTGYQSFPNAPSVPWVHRWNTTTELQVAWTAPSGGPPVDYVTVQLLNEAGTVLAAEDSTDVYSPVWGVSENTKYRIRTRSHGTNGLVSAWQEQVSPHRPKMGVASVKTYGNVNHSEAWSTPQVGGGFNDGAACAVYANTGSHGGNILLNGLHLYNMWAPQSADVSGSGYPSRWVQTIVYGTWYSAIHGGGFPDPVKNNQSQTRTLNHWAHDRGTNPGYTWGLVPRGSGWSTTNVSHYQFHIEALWLTGTEYWTSYDHTGWTTAVSNSGW